MIGTMKAESIVIGVAGTVFGLIVGWIIGTQQAPGRPFVQAAGAPADYARMTIAVTRPGISQFRWELAGPPGPGTFALPMLPGSFATYNLQASDSLDIRGYLRSAPGGWDLSRSCALQPDCYFLPLAVGAHAVASSPLTIVP